MKFVQVSAFASVSDTHVIEARHTMRGGGPEQYVAVRRSTARSPAVELGWFKSFDAAAKACRADLGREQAGDFNEPA